MAQSTLKTSHNFSFFIALYHDQMACLNEQYLVIDIHSIIIKTYLFKNSNTPSSKKENGLKNI